MTKLINTFAGGTHDALITAPGSASGGNGVDIVERGTGATVSYDTSIPGGGDVSARFATSATTATARVGWTSSLGSPAVVYCVAYVYLPALPSANQRIIQYLSSGNATRMSIWVTPTGQVQIAASNGAASTANRSTVSINIGSLARIEARVEMNTTGIAQLRLYNTSPLTSTTPTETRTGAATDFGGVAAGYYFGIPSPVASVGPVYLSAIGVSDTDWIGPDLTPSNTTPTISLFTPYPRYAWGDSVTLTSTVADPDNSATHTNAWTVPVKPTGSTLTIGGTTDIVTFEPDKPGNYTVRATTTDNAGATAFAEVSFTVTPAMYAKASGAEVPSRIYGS